MWRGNEDVLEETKVSFDGEGVRLLRRRGGPDFDEIERDHHSRKQITNQVALSDKPM